LEEGVFKGFARLAWEKYIVWLEYFVLMKVEKFLALDLNPGSKIGVDIKKGVLEGFYLEGKFVGANNNGGDFYLDCLFDETRGAEVMEEIIGKEALDKMRMAGVEFKPLRLSFFFKTDDVNVKKVK